MIHALWAVIAAILFVSGMKLGWRWGIEDAAYYVQELEEGVEGLEWGAGDLAEEIRGLKEQGMR